MNEPIPITVTVTFDGYSSELITHSSFELQIMNPCLTTSLYFGAISDMIYKFGDPDLTQKLLAIDQASVDYGNKDGLTLCGARSFSISTSIDRDRDRRLSTSHPEYLSLDGDTLKISTSNLDEIILPAV